jgi:ABC-type uncharacterized transport system substrate-binding protein
MDRRAFVTGLGAALAVSLAAQAEQARRVYKVGILASGAIPPIQSFRRGLRDLGYVEGQNLVIEARYHAGNSDRLPALAAELVELKVDVILALGSTEVRAAKQATRTIPIVFAVHNDPVGAGDVASLAHPGGNITGMAQMASELSAKQLELLREMIPGITRVAVVWNPTTPSHGPTLRQTEAAARAMGMQLSKIEARSGSELDGAFATAIRDHARALLLLVSAMAVVERARLVSVASKHRLPTMYGSRFFVDAGGLMSYGSDVSDLSRRAAAYVDKILKGAKPSDLPVEQATKFELVINLKTAKALGLTIPPSLLLRADQVIDP